MVIIHLADRTGDKGGPTILVDVKPNIGERVGFYNNRKEFIEARVVDVSHHLHFEQIRNKDSMSSGTNARIYVLLDLDANQL